MNSSKAGDIVVDLFGGAGSTLLGCEVTGRICLTTELDPKYTDVVITRWQDFTQRTAVLEGDGRTFAEIQAERAVVAA